ncbi:MAG: SDR family oxidoreductase [Saprospiraceae bacterium]|nr:SDR family oxidoreductase [Saprospiraceae bacterium]
MQRFSNQVAIVTGAARGIGQAIAHRLAKEGAQVFLLDLLEKPLQETVQAFTAEGLSVQAISIDISQEEQVKSAIQQVEAAAGQIDIMINSAGIIGHTNTKIVDYDLATFEQVHRVNLMGAFLLTKYVIPPMLSQQYGRILHIASIGGKEGNPGMIGYAASKSGLLGLVKGVGKEYADQGITVNGLAPAVIATPMNQDTAPETLAYMTSKIPMGRLGTVDEVASIACWIVSEEASFNTGFVFDLSGGRATF